MSDSAKLRETRTGQVINEESLKQEKLMKIAIGLVIEKLKNSYPLMRFEHKKRWFLKDIVENLKVHYQDVEWFYHFDSSFIRPDGGVLYLKSNNEKLYPILISEAKRQGTNVIRAKEGKEKQAKGNAIERLGKNVIAFRTALRNESILPFVCFGHGCDFREDSSILDRVTTIAMFSKLNQTFLFNEGANGIFNRGSFYFREEKWTIKEMETIMYDIANRAILYYISKYGHAAFKKIE